MYLTIRGLVLRATAIHDTDVLLTLLTEDRGKLTAKVRGLRRKNSPLTAPCQLLAYSEFTLFEYRGAYTVNEAQSIELFTKLRTDLSRLSLASYFAQVTELISQEDTPNPELLSLLLNSIYMLASTDAQEQFVKAVFELRCACLAGYMPNLSGCPRCGNPYPDRFDIANGVPECYACRDAASDGLRMPLLAGELEAMRYICSAEAKKLFSFSIGESTARMLSELTETYLTTQLERGFSALDFYKSLLYPTECT